MPPEEPTAAKASDGGGSSADAGGGGSPPGRTLLLDMDGVLAEVSKSYRASIVRTCHEYGAGGVGFDTVAERKVRGGCNNDWALSLELINSDPDGRRGLSLEEVTETFERHYQGDPSTGTKGLRELETLIPTKATLEELRRRCDKSGGGGGMAIVTGRPRKDCDSFLSRHGIDVLFDASVCMEDGPPKPDPFPVLRACELLGVEPSKSVVMVGDTPDDVVAALAAGCRGVGVSTPENAERAKEEGRGHDTCGLSVAMRRCGADVVLEPGLGGLLDIFPEAD